MISRNNHLDRSYADEVVSRVEALGKTLEVKLMGNAKFKAADYPLYYILADSNKKSAGHVFLSAGIHGGEPAGVYAILGFLESQVRNYLDDFSFIAFPCLNPSGFERGTRDNLNRVNLNRNFQSRKPSKEVSMLKEIIESEPRHYTFAMDMHEDDPEEQVENYSRKDNPRETYLYEVSNRNLSKGHRILNSLEKNGVPVCKKKKIYYDQADNGLIWRDEIVDTGHEEDTTLMWYLQRYTNNVFNPETPTCWKLERRVEVQIMALKAALDIFRK
jgi:protein MpaA